MSLSQWQWENAIAGAVSGFATVAAMYPLDIVRTRFQGFERALCRLLSCSFRVHCFMGIIFLLVSLCTNPIWLIKTRLQLQTPIHQSRPYSGVYDALRTILREEGWTALYKGLGPGLLMQVSHGAIQFTAYEELRRILVDYKGRKRKSESASNLLNSFDYAVLGGSSKIAAILVTYPFQVIRTRSQQRPSNEGIPRYMSSWHVVKETARFEGFRGFYKGITPNLLKNVPASSITFIVYENVLKLLRPTRRND
ncbi:folate transporter 1, chloroplastic isoform X4 [Durio zibethinus]|uniref:Folate transporter 1, chloroplastic isoform X4 n=1 Tax=Durio zibethinus TaxID=66656 RepID=A0A6P6BE44_DURZI|nr:folate transporter 1, chloroplastic isoform X4 [Durio zibethinus]